MTDPFAPQVGYSALKPMMKYETLSLQVSMAGGLEQATAYISLLNHAFNATPTKRLQQYLLLFTTYHTDHTFFLPGTAFTS